jgi:hypothetical protein
MPAPSIVYVSRGSPNQIYRIDGGVTSVQIGPNLTGAETATSNLWKTNYAAEFRGRLYAVAGAGNGTVLNAYRYDVQANTWTTVNTGTIGQAGSAFSTAHGGLYIIHPGGVPTLFYCGGGTAGGDGLIWKTTDGTTWNANTITSMSTKGNGIGIVFRNILYAIQASSNIIAAIDANAGSYTDFVTAAMSAGTSGGGAFCIFRNRLFVLRYPLTGAMTLWELFGGAWVSRGTLDGASATPSATTVADSGCALFAVDDTKMVAVYIDSNGTNHGSKACDITPTGPTTFSFLDQTANMIPASLDPEPTAAFQSHGWHSYVDNETVPGTPVTYLWHLSDASSGGVMSYFEYVNSTSLLGPGSIGVAATMVPAVSRAGGGERAWTATSLGAEFTSFVGATTPGRLRLTVRTWGDTLYGPSGSSGGRRTEVRLATTGALPANTPAGVGVGYNALENTNLSQATLAGVVTGNQPQATRIGNEIQQVIADGVTTITYEWDVLADGVPVNQQIVCFPETAIS